MSKVYQIYVACLSAYTHSFIHGEWIDATQDEETILAEINTMLTKSPVVKLYGEVPEEWAIHSSEGFHGIEIGEYESIAKVAQLAQELEKHGEPYAAYLNYFSDGTVTDFEDKYQGCFENCEDFAYKLYDEMGTIEKLEKAGLNTGYINFVAIAHNLFIDSYINIEKGHNKLYVFSRN